MLARALSGTVSGLDGVRVEVEADIADGLPGFHIVGLGDRALQEARERVKIAINNSGFQFPGRKVTINLAPAQLPKEGSGFDLAMAAAIVNAGEDRGLPADAVWLGELALDGTVRAIRGTLAIVAHLDRLGARRFYVPTANVAEARIATAASVLGINHLRDLKAHWETGAPLEVSTVSEPAAPPSRPAPVDLAEVCGQPHAKRALEVAAAGAHHLLLVGPPGAGKTLLARALPGILPPLDRREAVEVTSIASCVGMLPAGAGLLELPPFRAPHHTISPAALVGGGGAVPRPGEVTRAHTWVTLYYMNMSTATAPPTTAVQAGIYVRISHDPDHNELGVQRQERDCRALAKRHAWSIVRVYADDDLSAFTGKPRPSFVRLLEDVRSGIVTAVIAWHPDRLYRHPKDLEEFITVIEHAGCTVETVQAGDLNLATPSGRAVARTLGAWGRYESEHKSARLKAKHRELAEAGKDGGSGRPFGYEADRQTIRPTEAALIREAADRVLAGEALRSVCRDWNRRGVKSTTGRLWSVKVFKGMLISARISGRRERGTDEQGNRLVIGPIVATATWPGIITPEQSDRLRARLTDPTRSRAGGGGQPTKYLLTGGPAVCGLCGPCVCPQDRCGRREQHPSHDWGTALVSRPKQNWRKGQPPSPSIVCAAGPGFKGKGCIRIASGPLDALVTEAVFQAIDKGALARALRGSGEDRKAVDELVGVEQKLADLAEDWASDRVTRGEWDAARKALAARQDALRRRVEASRRQVGLDGLPDPLRTAWPSLPLHRQRAVVSALVEAVVVGRGVRGLNRFDPRRISIKWKA